MRSMRQSAQRETKSESQNRTRVITYEMLNGTDRLSTQVYYYIEFLQTR